MQEAHRLKIRDSSHCDANENIHMALGEAFRVGFSDLDTLMREGRAKDDVEEQVATDGQGLRDRNPKQREVGCALLALEIEVGTIALCA